MERILENLETAAYAAVPKFVPGTVQREEDGHCLLRAHAFESDGALCSVIAANGVLYNR